MKMNNKYPATLLQLKEMKKTFPGVVANDDIDLVLKTGEIHALLGENGAGKSTLVKIICGILKADAGKIEWMGTPVSIDNPTIARKLGITMVFQHFSLFDSLSVTENIALGIDSRQSCDLENLKSRISNVSNRYGLPVDPDRHVCTLSMGERQRIEIIRCLLQDPKLLVMDEPTSVLTPQEVANLFETLQCLADEGVAILYISHKLDEIKAICRKATILRVGKVVDSVEVEPESVYSLAAKMMGEELEAVPYKSGRSYGPVCLEVTNLNLSTKDEFGIALKKINFQVHSGEIVGIAGVAGNGQDELLKALNGESICGQSDSIKINDKPCGFSGPNKRRAMGLASIPGERLGYGAVPLMSLKENSLLTAFQRLGLVNKGVIDLAACGRYCGEIIDKFNVKANGIESAAESLSGGNLQKFIIGREILQRPNLLVVAQPTWGVDAGATQIIHKALRALSEEGAAILIISQDLDELMTICDSISAIYMGSLSAVFPIEEISIDQIGLMMTGSDG